MRKFTILIALFISCLLLSCKDAYDITKANAPIRLPEEMGAKYTTPNGVKVYSSRPPSQAVLQALGEGVQITIDKTTRDIPGLEPHDLWKQWDKFKKPSDYSIILIKPDYASQNEITKGCSLITMDSGMTVAGVVVGYKIGYGAQRVDDSLIVLPFPEVETRNCLEYIVRDGARNEAEHIRLLNDTRLFVYYSGANDIHPIFP